MNAIQTCHCRFAVALCFAFVLAAEAQTNLPAPASPLLPESNLTKYIFVMRAPGQGMNQAVPDSFNRAHFEEVLKHLPNRPDSRVQTGISFIFSCLRTPPEVTLESLRNFLRVAEETSTPVFLHFDMEHWWEARPDLWNWWDPASPGYDPANRENVEWTGWSSEHAIKISWRNWGSQFRTLPPPNLASPRYVQACRAELRRVIPVILKWRDELPDSKKHIFVGVKVGHESSIGVNAYYYPNGNEFLAKPASEDPNLPLVGDDVLSRGMTQIGYAALMTSGIRTRGDITEPDLAEVVRQYLQTLCREAAQCGVPREQLFSHAAGWKDGELMNDAAVNDYSSPGWSFYKHAEDPLKEPAVPRNLKRSDAPYWAAAEWLLQKPHETEAWRRALANTLAEKRCRLVCIFNWESIRDSEEVKAAIRHLVEEASPEKTTAKN